MPTWDEFKKELKISEGEVSHMYLDTRGNVTVGVGNLLANVAAAQKFGFVTRSSGASATKEEIETDFEAVAKQTPGLGASAYKKYTKLDLPQTEIEKVLDNRINGLKKELRGVFSKFDKYPMTAQFALVDMAFNIGTTGLVTKFPKFKKAIEDEDWATAAIESYRKDVSAQRNATVKKWLEDAGTQGRKSAPSNKAETEKGEY